MNKPIIILLCSLLLILLWALSWIFGWPYTIPMSISLGGLIGGSFLYLLFSKINSNDTKKIFRIKKTSFSGTLSQDKSLQCFEKSLIFIKRSKIPNNASRTFSEIPWYIAMGESLSGRSTVLQNAKFENLFDSQLFTTFKTSKPHVFDYPQTFLKDKTQNCQIWISQDAVFICPPETWQKNATAWELFSRILQKNQGKHQLKGMVSFLDSTLFVSDSHSRETKEKISSQIDSIKKRTATTSTLLHNFFPSYFLFTKTDLIPGFQEMFERLSQEERKTPWGFILPFRGQHHENLESLNQKLKQMDAKLIQHIGWRLDHKTAYLKQKSFFLFPRSFRKLRLKLTPFLTSILDTSSDNAPFQLRGLFWSASPQLKPHQTFSSQDNENEEKTSAFFFKNDSKNPSIKSNAGYFSAGFLHQTLLNDQSLSIPLEQLSGKLHTQKSLIAMCATLLSFIFLILSGTSWYRNANLLQGIQKQALPFLAPALGTSNAAFDHLPNTKKSIEPLKRLIHFHSNGIPFLSDMGLYQGEKVFPKLSRNFLEVYKSRFITPLLSAYIQTMEDETSSPTSQTNPTFFENQIIALQNYQWLTFPKPSENALPFENTSPPENTFISASKTQILSDIFSADLLKHLSNQPKHHPKTQAWIAEHISLYLTVGHLFDQWGAQKEESKVNTLQNQYWQSLLDGQWIHLLQTKTQEDQQSIQVQKLVGNTKSIVSHPNALHGVFTAEGWHKTIKHQIQTWPKEILGPFWMWSIQPISEIEKREKLETLQTLYFQSYKNAWTQWLGKIQIQSPDQHISSLEILNILLGQETSIWEKLFEAIEKNTSLKTKIFPDLAIQKNSAESDTSDNTSQPSPSQIPSINSPFIEKHIQTLEQAFEPLLKLSRSQQNTNKESEETPPSGLDLYLKELRQLKTALQNYEQDQNRESFIQEIQRARGNVRGILNEQNPYWASIIENLLWTPIDIASQNHNQHISQIIANAWCQQVTQPFNAQFKNHFPFHQETSFNTNGFSEIPTLHTTEASLENFNSFFHPKNGSLWRFFQTTLSSQVEKEGERFVFREQLGNNLQSYYAQNLLTFLTHAKKISTALFHPRSETPHFQFEIRIHPVSQISTISFSVGEEQVNYRNGIEKWQPISWPGEEPEAGAEIKLIGLPGSQETMTQLGAWGLFHLLGQAEVIQFDREGKTFSLSWKLVGNSQPLIIDFKFQGKRIPFEPTTQTFSLKQQVISVLDLSTFIPPERLDSNQNESCIEDSFEPQKTFPEQQENTF